VADQTPLKRMASEGTQSKSASEMLALAGARRDITHCLRYATTNGLSRKNTADWMRSVRWLASQANNSPPKRGSFAMQAGGSIDREGADFWLSAPGVGYSPANDFENSPDGISFEASVVSRRDEYQALRTTFSKSGLHV